MKEEKVRCPSPSLGAQQTTYQKPEGPDVEGKAAEHLHNGCQQDHILKVPVGRRETSRAKNNRRAPFSSRPL